MKGGQVHCAGRKVLALTLPPSLLVRAPREEGRRQEEGRGVLFYVSISGKIRAGCHESLFLFPLTFFRVSFLGG